MSSALRLYLDALETADLRQPVEVEAKSERLREKMRLMRRVKEELQKEPDGQRSLADPDSRAMMLQAKSMGIVG